MNNSISKYAPNRNYAPIIVVRALLNPTIRYVMRMRIT